MRPIKPNARRRPLWRSVLLVFLLLVGGGAATVAALAGLKVIDPAKLAFWRRKETRKEAHPAGWIPIPLSARLIPAHTAVTRDYLMNPKTGALELKWVAPDRVPKGIISDVSTILDRVTAHEKQAIYFFKESDFLPLGTRPGVEGGTPPGKRAITLDAVRLKGCVFELKEGDHLDLLASVPVDMPGAGRSGQFGSVMATPDTLLLPKRSLVRPLVQDGVVVSPVTTRLVPTSNSSLMNGTTTRNMRVQEIVLAVAPDEVAPLDEAMDLRYQLTCVARSGQPAPTPAPDAQRPAGGTSPGGTSQFLAALGKALLGEGQSGAAAAGKAMPPPATAKTVKPMTSETPAKDRLAVDITPGLNPMADMHFMELMIGPRRQFMLFSGPGNSPVVAGQDDGSVKADTVSAPAATTGAAPAATTGATPAPADAAAESGQ